VAYQKGSLALFELSERIGEERLNHALGHFADEYRFKGPPYPTSLDMIRHIRAATPDSLQYLVTDLFEKVDSTALESE